MLTINTIIEEMKGVPVTRLVELFHLVHSMNTQPNHSNKIKKQILTYGGCFNEMSETEFIDFQNHLKQSRESLFNRNIDI